MLAKVIAHAPTRAEAALKLARALARSRIRGVVTNRDFLVAALRHPEFLAGRTTTAFIESAGVPPARQPSPAELHVAAVAAALAGQAANRAATPVLRSLPGGWRNSVMPPERAAFRHGSGVLGVSYRRQRDGSFAVQVSGPGEASAQLTVTAEAGDDGWIGLAGGGHAHRLHVLARGQQVWVQGPDGDVALTALPRFPEADREAVAGGLAAPMPGTVLAVHVQPGDRVSAGQLLMIVEAMKMEHRITAPHPGVVGELHARGGDQVAAGDILVVIETRPGADEPPAGPAAARVPHPGV